MARVIINDPANLTGHVGPVAFFDGVGETDDAELLAAFATDPRFTIEAPEAPEAPAQQPAPQTTPVPRAPRTRD